MSSARGDTGPGSSVVDKVWGVAVDQVTDAPVVVGELHGSIDFGSAGFSTAALGGAGFVAKLDPSTGSPAWRVMLGDGTADAGAAGSASARGVAVDANGAVLVTGRFTGPIDIVDAASTQARSETPCRRPSS